MTRPIAPEVRRARDRRTASIAAVLFVIGGMTWRVRSATALADNPVDAAAGVRLASDVLAFVFALPLAFRIPRYRAGVGPAAVYAAYIVVVVLGMWAAVDYQVVAFRVVDLTVSLLVALAVVHTSSSEQVVTLIRRVLWGFVAAITVGAVVSPGKAFDPARGGIVPFRLQGVFPELSNNSVGSVGIVLFGLGLAASGRSRVTQVGVGAILILLSQYRTGYVAVAAMLLAYLVLARGLHKNLAAIAMIPLGYFVYTSATFQNAWVRGEASSNSVATLSGRTDFWAAGIHVAARSPIIGTGLSSGTRFEVLQQTLGIEDASTIHGTWIEAYVGTGFVGAGLLAFFSVAAIRSAVSTRRVSLAPILVIVPILIRSLTGSTFELASWTSLFMLLLAIDTHRTAALGRPVTADELAPLTKRRLSSGPTKVRRPLRV